jgi:carbonic anhydrase
MNLLMWHSTVPQGVQVSKGPFLDSVIVDFENGTLAFVDQVSVERYQILQFHLHAPSEHTFNGKFYDLELHLVH